MVIAQTAEGEHINVNGVQELSDNKRTIIFHKIYAAVGNGGSDFNAVIKLAVDHAVFFTAYLNIHSRNRSFLQ